jgi:hypothetical protein
VTENVKYFDYNDPDLAKYLEENGLNNSNNNNNNNNNDNIIM